MLVYQRVFDSDSALFNFSHIHWKLLNMCPLPVGKFPWYVGVNPHPPSINQASTIYHNSITRYSITRYHQIFNIIYQPPVNFTNWDGFNGITFWVLNIKYVWYMNIIEYHCLPPIYPNPPDFPTLPTLPPAPAQTSRCSGVPCACPLLRASLEPCEGGTTLEGRLEDVPKLKPIEMRGDFGVSLTKHHQLGLKKHRQLPFGPCPGSVADFWPRVHPLNGHWVQRDLLWLCSWHWSENWLTRKLTIKLSSIVRCSYWRWWKQTAGYWAETSKDLWKKYTVQTCQGMSRCFSMFF